MKLDKLLKIIDSDMDIAVVGHRWDLVPCGSEVAKEYCYYQGKPHKFPIGWSDLKVVKICKQLTDYDFFEIENPYEGKLVILVEDLYVE